MMRGNDVTRWLEEDGQMFLREIGIQQGHVIVDFGCGSGHYTLPAATIVQPEGTVYAIDKDQAVLDRVMQIAASRNLNHIIPMNTLGTVTIALDDKTIDVVLLYDVIHYRDTEGRRDLYREIYRLLKPGALLSVYPKHHQSDLPSSHLADRTIDDIIKEIEAAHLSCCGKTMKALIHDDAYTQGPVLSFRKMGRQVNRALSQKE